MVEVVKRQTALVSAIVLLLTALVCPASAQVPDTQDTVDDTQDAVQDTVDDTQDATQDTVDETQDAVQDTVDETQDATQDTVDDTQDATNGATEGVKRTKADQKKAGSSQDAPKDDVDDLSELIAEGESIGGTSQARDEPEPRQTSPLDRVAEMLGLPITGMELLVIAAIAITLALIGVALWRLGRRKPSASISRREIKHT